MENAKAYIYGIAKSKKSSGPLERQFEVCLKYAEAHGIHIAGFFLDNLADKASGRPGMENMLAEVEKNNITTIIVMDLSCIDQDFCKAGKYLLEMEKKGLSVISIKGVGGDLFAANNYYLPASIFKYLQESQKM